LLVVSGGLAMMMIRIIRSARRMALAPFARGWRRNECRHANLSSD
jgi:hypothetical protein